MCRTLLEHEEEIANTTGDFPISAKKMWKIARLNLRARKLDRKIPGLLESTTLMGAAQLLHATKETGGEEFDYAKAAANLYGPFGEVYEPNFGEDSFATSEDGCKDGSDKQWVQNFLRGPSNIPVAEAKSSESEDESAAVVPTAVLAEDGTLAPGSDSTGQAVVKPRSRPSSASRRGRGKKDEDEAAESTAAEAGQIHSGESADLKFREVLREIFRDVNKSNKSTSPLSPVVNHVLAEGLRRNEDYLLKEIFTTITPEESKKNTSRRFQKAISQLLKFENPDGRKLISVDETAEIFGEAGFLGTSGEDDQLEKSIRILQEAFPKIEKSQIEQFLAQNEGDVDTAKAMLMSVSDMLASSESTSEKDVGGAGEVGEEVSAKKVTQPLKTENPSDSADAMAEMLNDMYDLSSMKFALKVLAQADFCFQTARFFLENAGHKRKEQVVK